MRHAVVESREPRGFATIGWHHVQLRVPLCLTLRDKGQARAIGRPAGGGIAFGASGETAWLAPGGLYDPDGGQVLIVVLRGPGYDERDLSSIARESWSTHPLEA